MNAESKCIYIIDDDESVCRALKCLLITFGFGVTTFLSAAQYFQDVAVRDKGCLLLDIHMPGMDGWETLKKTLKSGNKRPVIIISAEKTAGLRERALKFGAIGYLKKPINSQELVDLINSVS